MKITAVIAEYNPIHNGHAGHIKKAKEETGADYIVAVMSGDYVQRGAPAVISKYERAKEALLTGIDLVIELPSYYSSGSLEYFASGATALLQKLGIADFISFGSECGDIDMLKRAASFMPLNEKRQDPTLPRQLSYGTNYSKAVNSSEGIPEDVKAVLATPNNLLAAAYINTAESFGLNCGFHTTKRTKDAYNDVSPGALSSSSIRAELLSSLEPASKVAGISARIPENAFDSLLGYLGAYSPVSEDDLSLPVFLRIQDIIKTSLCRGDDPADVLASYLDVSKGLSHKILNRYEHATSFTDLCRTLKSKDLNHARISRALLHIILGIRSEYSAEYINDGYVYYARPLGFKRSAGELMHELKKRSSIPIVSKNADAKEVISSFYMSDSRDISCQRGTDPGIVLSHALRMFREDIASSDLYMRLICNKIGRPFISEYERSAVII
ncbi:MAG: nucleotidyltransferase family protein [Lachnospiraceae bacterium]|nr:nucleotidyltransferase family protein [Lachnospiraceae bacterium]